MSNLEIPKGIPHAPSSEAAVGGKRKDSRLVRKDSFSSVEQRTKKIDTEVIELMH